MTCPRYLRNDHGPTRIVSRGAILVHGNSVPFTTNEPSPGRWIAIATTGTPFAREPRVPRCMVVGCGRSERGAVDDLRQRILESASTSPYPPAAEVTEQPVVVWEDGHDPLMES
ncbi:MAG TPA: hypothetical protein VHA53_10720 [Nitrolancea sp.]|nr:hypothetical protein [Nitrolancea sp.]